MEYHKCKLNPALSLSSSPSFSSSTEGIKNEPSRNVRVRKRSRRFRKPESSWFGDQQHFQEMKPIKNQSESSTPEPVSSISDASPEEAVAYCLMMLSRDKWIDDEETEEELASDSESDESSESESVTKVKRLPRQNCYKCQTCNKIFRSYQALGGHIASHKKIKPNNRFQHNNYQQTQVESKMHKCHVCFKVFASGQALGGHKRSHASAKQVMKPSINLIDLNLPAPMDADDDH
ncbi:zinc finger protein ZAT9-like [Bidens hawaiensis]|uniref:zinc finger protein ZAT9-like n=1 Tax=Bidens hawaiensis TaxID=980011 RepID=UPI00404B61A9